jgi:conjugal transfer pilin signal peptidase TrbI
MLPPRARSFLRFVVPVVGALALLKVTVGGRLLINFTPSIPRGVYWISRGAEPNRGDLVTFPIPAEVQDLIYQRHYVSPAIRLLAKPVVGVGGDPICIRDHQLFLGEQRIAGVVERDQQGLPLEPRPICRTLGNDELFVATRRDNSFDSRYFGPIAKVAVLGTLKPLATF